MASKEGLTLPESFGKEIAVKSDGNLRKALLLFEAAKVQQFSNMFFFHLRALLFLFVSFLMLIIFITITIQKKGTRSVKVSLFQTQTGKCFLKKQHTRFLKNRVPTGKKK